MNKAVAQAMDDLDDAVQVGYCQLFNDGRYVEAMLLARNAKVIVTNRWSDSEDTGVVERAADLLVKYLDMERRAEKATKEVS